MVELSDAAALLAVIFIVVALLKLSALEKRVAALSGLHHKLDALLTHAGIKYNPYDNLPEDVIKAIQRGEKIQAIKHYRAATGVGLKEAKEFIEEVQRRVGAGA
jgi:ribosomal protein L7/L12